jgi:flagellar hook assembly protein FlgD
LKEPSHVRLRIYDASGRLVRALVDQKRKANICSEMWDVCDQSGRRVANGVYFYTMSTKDLTKPKR